MIYTFKSRLCCIYQQNNFVLEKFHSRKTSEPEVVHTWIQFIFGVLEYILCTVSMLGKELVCSVRLCGRAGNDFSGGEKLLRALVKKAIARVFDGD